MEKNIREYKNIRGMKRREVERQREEGIDGIKTGKIGVRVCEI